jgi:uncharacterized Fe-S cluster protein YjdI
MAKQKTIVIKRNMQTCSGLRGCGKCLEDCPGLEYGDVVVQKWAQVQPVTIAKIEKIINGCPERALSIE